MRQLVTLTSSEGKNARDLVEEIVATAEKFEAAKQAAPPPRSD